MTRKKRHLEELVTLRPVSIDEFSAVRHLHRMSIMVLGKDYHSDLETAARIMAIDKASYTQLLQQQNLWGAWMDRMLIATSGWFPHDPERGTAYISALYVHPFFARMGLGSLMLKEAEKETRKKGFRGVYIRANRNAAAFFEHNNYKLLGHDSDNIGRNIHLPITIMEKNASLNKKTPCKAQKRKKPPEKKPDSNLRKKNAENIIMENEPRN